MSVIDLNTYNTLKESIGADFISTLTDTFIEDGYTQMEQMKAALDARDAETFRRAAHSLKSNSATFGAMNLSALARELEMMGREENLEAGSRFEVLKEAFELAKSQLNELRQVP
jgi:HPt (histidine-containing phosphotransfer) domain-containing protein